MRLLFMSISNDNTCIEPNQNQNLFKLISNMFMDDDQHIVLVMIKDWYVTRVKTS